MTPEDDTRPRRAWRRRLAVGALFALGWMLVGIELGITRPWTRNPPCERLGVGEPIVAPESGWSARVREEACGDGFFVTVVFSAVEVSTTRGAGWRDIVRVAETDTVQQALTVGWDGARTLLVRVHAPLGTQLRPNEVPGLRLKVTTDAETAR